MNVNIIRDFYDVIRDRSGSLGIFAIHEDYDDNNFDRIP